MDGQTCKALIQLDEGCYGESFKMHLLEQYKLYVQSVDNVSARRVSSNRYLLTVNAALIASYGFQSVISSQLFLVIPVAVAGIVISVLSFIIIKSHHDLNDTKFRVINEFEQHLPAAPYDYEWAILKERRGKPYRPISEIEWWIPIVFAVLHVIALMFVIAFMLIGLPSWAT